MSTAINTMKRTPAQDEAYFEALRTADRIATDEQRQVSEEEFSRIYGATLRRHMMEALEPIRKEKARYLAALDAPRVILCETRGVQFIEPPPASVYLELDQLEKLLASQYTHGFPSMGES